MKKLIFNLLILLSLSFLFQGFQCASREMTTAQTEYAKENYQAAVDNLEIELANNPANEKARMMLIKIKIEQGKYMQAAKIVQDTDSILTNPEYKSQIPQYKNLLWVNSYNSGMRNYRKFQQFGNAQDIDSAIFFFQTGSIIRPEILDFYYFEAFSHLSKGDTITGMNMFEKYISMLEDEIVFARDNQLFWNQEIDNAINSLRIETKVVIDTLDDGKKTRVDKSQIYDDDLYIYSFAEFESFNIQGFRLNLPADWTDGEINTPFDFKMDAFSRVIQFHYSNKDYENALDFSKKMQALDPFNRDVNNFIVQIYRDLNQEDVAIEELKSLINEQPDNELYYVLLADLFTNLGRYDDAIAQYEASLKVNENYPIALRNLGSTYKNKASDIQKEETEKAENQEGYEVDREKYFPFLMKSVQAFNKCLNTEEYKDNAEVLCEVAEIYHVTEKEKELLETLTKLRNVESKVPSYYKEKYYYNLLKIYSDRNNEAKTTELTRKINQLGG